MKDTDEWRILSARTALEDLEEELKKQEAEKNKIKLELSSNEEWLYSNKLDLHTLKEIHPYILDQVSRVERYVSNWD